MNLAVLATVFGVVFVAELPDKTALASLVLGTRYRPVFVFAGAAAAFVGHVVLAVSAGSVLSALAASLRLRRKDDDDAEGGAAEDRAAGEPDRPQQEPPGDLPGGGAPG